MSLCGSSDGAGFAELMEKVRNGSDAAAWDLVERYGDYILRTVRRTLHHELRSKFDSQDFAQAVWASFFACPEKFDRVERPEQLIGLLAKMARNKVVDETRRRMTTQKYCVRRERSLETLGDEPRKEVKADDPTPSQLAIARERWNQMLLEQPDHYRQVIRLKLMGQTHRSIANQLNVSEKTVQRVLDRVLKRRLVG